MSFSPCECPLAWPSQSHQLDDPCPVSAESCQHQERPAYLVDVTLLCVLCHPFLLTRLCSRALAKLKKREQLLVTLPLRQRLCRVVASVASWAVALLIHQCPYFPHEPECDWCSVSLRDFTCHEKGNGVGRVTFSLMLGLTFLPQDTLWKGAAFPRLTAGQDEDHSTCSIKSLQKHHKHNTKSEI